MASVSKRRWKRPDGSHGEKWVVRYVDRTGARRNSTFERKKEADKFLASVTAEIFEKGFANHIEAATIEELSKHFVREQDSRYNDGEIGRSRLENIILAVNKAIIPRIGKLVVKDLTSKDVEDWYKDLRAAGMTAITSRDRVRELKLLLDYGQRHNFCTQNVASVAMRAGLKRRPTTAIRTFSREDIAALLQAAETRYPYQHERSFQLMRLVVNIAAFCGLRWGEIFALSLRRVNLDHAIFEVRHSLTEWDEIKGPKTAAGNRDVPIPEHIVILLRDWIRDHHFPNERDLIFRVGTRENPKMLNAGNFHVCHWRKLLRRAGLENTSDHLHFHALRHFAASWWIMNGLPIPDTASLLGHSRFDMTLQTYAHAIVGGQRTGEVLQNMAARLRPLTQAVNANDAQATQLLISG